MGEDQRLVEEDVVRYTLYKEEDRDPGRPYVIRRADGSVVFTFLSKDERFAIGIARALNEGAALSPDDTDTLARSA